jgi:hypothetical protein
MSYSNGHHHTSSQPVAAIRPGLSVEVSLIRNVFLTVFNFFSYL